MSKYNGTIIALGASYINTDTRLKHFFIMLDSWIKQECPCVLIISMSIIDDNLYNKYKYLISEIYEKNDENITSSLRISLHRERFSQFKHYKLIINEHSYLLEFNPWTIFTDDDDIWHPLRTYNYYESIKHLSEINNNNNNNNSNNIIDHIECSYHAESSGIDIKDYKNNNEIDKDIQNGLIKKSNDGNYVNSCIKLEMLNYFIENSNDELLNCVYADVRFHMFLRSYGCKTDKKRIGLDVEESSFNNCWMYFYRHVSDPKGSITNDKTRLPTCVLYSEELKRKFYKEHPDNRYLLSIILNNIELSICYGEYDFNKIKKENEITQLEKGCNAKYIMENIRPLYPLVDEFLKHEYYKKLMENSFRF